MFVLPPLTLCCEAIGAELIISMDDVLGEGDKGTGGLDAGRGVSVGRCGDEGGSDGGSDGSTGEDESGASTGEGGNDSSNGGCGEGDIGEGSSADVDGDPGAGERGGD